MTYSRRTLITIFAAVACTACGCSLSNSDTTVADAQKTQKVAEANPPVLVSHKFHTVIVSPHESVAQPGSPWRFYIQIRNGSALEVPFVADQVHLLYNGHPVRALSNDEIRVRIQTARSEALAKLSQTQGPLGFGPERDLKEDSFDRDWSPSDEAREVKAQQSALAHSKEEIEKATKRSLANLESHQLANKTLAPGERFDTFVELPMPLHPKDGDRVTLKIGLEPDVHEFTFLLSNS